MDDVIPTPGFPTPDATPRPRHRFALGVAAGALATLLIAGAGVGAYAFLHPATVASTPAVIEPQLYQPTTPSATSGLDVTPATDTQKTGVVTISTDLYYGQGAAAGTGIILSSDGTILTNNHVVEGSTKIEVTVEGTGETYTADVVGTDPVDDIAVLKLEGASGLTPATLDQSQAAVGDAVTSIGNAEGTGDLVAAAGSVTDLDQTITVTDDLTGKPKDLTGLIELDADVVAGDSGGPLLDDQGEVTGIVTAASSGTRTLTGYAIPIATALDVAAQILAGDDSGNVSLGLPAFMGITLDRDGVTVSGVIDGLPAARAGLGAGDTITSVDGTKVAGLDDLTRLIDAHQPGDSVTIGYTDAAGASSAVTLTLVGGPAE